MPYKDKEIAKQKARERWLKNKEAIKARKKLRYHQDIEKTRENNRLWYEKNKHAILQNQKLRRQTFEGWRKMVWQSVRARAAELNLDFNLTHEDIPPLPEHCPLLGIPLELGVRAPGSASLDRIDNTQGYVKGNVQIISDRANRLKRDASLDELIKIGEWAKARCAQRNTGDK
jgi:hypothetical protein